ncbi:MAG: HdeD family acid-resistance protein [Lawsonibacter sp.]
MKTILHAQRRSSIAAAAVTIALGLVLVGWPDRSIHFLCMLLGASIFLTGIIYFLGWLARRQEGVPVFFVLPGVVLCALGIWLMTSPASVVLLIQYIFGAILIVHGAVDLQGAAALMRQRWNRWWADLLLALLTVALGALILVNPFGTFAALVILIGVALVFDGLSDLYIIFRLSRAFKAAELQAQEEEQDLEQ